MRWAVNSVSSTSAEKPSDPSVVLPGDRVCSMPIRILSSTATTEALRLGASSSRLLPARRPHHAGATTAALHPDGLFVAADLQFAALAVLQVERVLLGEQAHGRRA